MTVNVSLERVYVPTTYHGARVSLQRVYVPIIRQEGARVSLIRVYAPVFNPDGRRRQAMVGSF